MSKSAVKSLAESLAHSLIPTSVSAHLLVPGYTYTKLTSGGGVPSVDKKPAAAWTADQVAEELFARLSEFYIICPDVSPHFGCIWSLRTDAEVLQNDVSWETDAARIEWNVGDILNKRPALSRWHPEHKDAFAKFLADKVPK